MPTYEYECEKSGKRFDFFHKSMNDKPLKTCPECGGPVRRLISSQAGIIFKGTGFYATDYAKSSTRNTPACGNERTCCGRDNPCGTPPCRE